jgi:hypothetical protein
MSDRTSTPHLERCRDLLADLERAALALREEADIRALNGEIYRALERSRARCRASASVPLLPDEREWAVSVFEGTVEADFMPAEKAGVR